MRRLQDLLMRVRHDESGSFLVIFGLLAIVLIATSGAVVDFTYAQTSRSRAQTALDAAALALQSKVAEVSQNKTTKAAAEADVKAKALSLMQERLNDSSITATITSATIDTATGKIDLKASITVPTAFVQLVGVRTISAQINSQAIRGSRDLEVSVALDVTGSMMPCDRWGNCDSTKINALKTATQNLINDLVSTTQTPTYSKMALVPYSYGVNPGPGATYVDKVRGAAVTVQKNFTSASWATGTAKSISSAKRGTPVTIVTSSNHGFASGDTVYIAGVSSMSSINGNAYKITVTGSKTFTLDGSSVFGWQDGSGGTVTKCSNASCDVKITGTGIGNSFATNDGVYLTGVSGYGDLNNTGFFVTKVDANNLLLSKSFAAGGDTSTTVTGKITRANYGDIYYHFNTAAGGENTFAVSDCVTERAGSEAFTDAPPTTTPAGFMYPSTSSNCVTQKIVPLTSDRAGLTTVASSLTAAGSTAGHIGLAWAWYMLSPDYIAGVSNWPTSPIDSRPAAYKRSNLLKALILMTDGAFNTAYCNGVTSADSSPGSSQAINCNAPNSDSITQAKALCTNIKADRTGIELYTVGFDIGTGDPTKDSADEQAAQAFLGGCATDTAHFYMAQTADDLKNSFSQIAQKLNALRLSH
jgi:Flp pilus assembly protein TadG